MFFRAGGVFSGRVASRVGGGTRVACVGSSSQSAVVYRVPLPPVVGGSGRVRVVLLLFVGCVRPLECSSDRGVPRVRCLGAVPGSALAWWCFCSRGEFRIGCWLLSLGVQQGAVFASPSGGAFWVVPRVGFRAGSGAAALPGVVFGGTC